MSLNIEQWHKRYRQQAEWTLAIRNHIYSYINIYKAQRILDVGCGTGLLLKELRMDATGTIIGIDVNFPSLVFAKTNVGDLKIAAGDARNLPYIRGLFDITLCHFVLLWINDPLSALKEMVRVTRPGGFVLALAEPDYGGRIDYPFELSKIGEWQIDALRDQGANPFIGRELRSLFTLAGLFNVEVGVLGGQWKPSDESMENEIEWDVIQSDLQNNIEFIQVLPELKKLDHTSRINNQRILFVPTFYAIGEVKT